jgi:hypothetical protein
VASSDAPGFRKKLIENAVTTLTQLIKQDNADRNLRRLVFVVEPEKDRGPRDFNVNLSVRLDVDNSDF